MKDISAHILNLFSSYITNDISEKEFKELEHWLNQDKQNKAIFSEYLYIYKRSRQIGLYQTIDKEKTWSIIVSNLNTPLEKLKKKEENKITPIFKLWFKYAAAAILVGVLISAFIFRDSLFNHQIYDNTTPKVVSPNFVLPGSDKATLTLEDGSVVVLEKGNTYQTQNANSNGEQIVYGTTDKNSAELEYNYLTIPRGGQFFIKLSDGSQVWLNSESQLKYPVNFRSGKTRKIELVYGEAYFDVSPSTNHNGSKFIVLNKSQEIEVIGTEFNLKAYKDEFNIYTTLVEGEVLVSTQTTSKILKPTQQSNFNLNDHSISIAEVNVYNEISWKEGVFSFHKKPLGDIMKVLSRWYDVDVEFSNPEIEKEGFNGVLGKEQNLSDILETIKTFGIIKEYKILDKTVFLE